MGVKPYVEVRGRETSANLGQRVRRIFATKKTDRVESRTRTHRHIKLEL
jgi:hypothetical protein